MSFLCCCCAAQYLNMKQILLLQGPVSAPMSAPSDARAHQFDARPAAGNQRSQAPMSHQELAAMSHLFNPAHAQGGYGLQQHINSGLPLQVGLPILTCAADISSGEERIIVAGRRGGGHGRLLSCLAMSRC